MSGAGVADRAFVRYSIDLPEGWLALDLGPSAMERLRTVLDAAAEADEDVRKNRAKIEQLFGDAISDAEDAGIESCACLYTVVDDVLPMQATVTVASTAIEGSNDVGAIFEGLSDGEPGRTIDVVRLDCGEGVRRSGRRAHTFPGTEEPVEFATRQFYVPVPGATDQVVLLTFATPTLELEADMCNLFDAIAQTLTFSHDG